MKNKFTKVFICTILCVILSFSVSLAEAETKLDKVKKPTSINAQNAIMVEAKTGNVMWSKNAYDKAYPASTTKLMTAILFYEANKDNMKKTFTVGDELNSMPSDSSTMGIKKGDQVTAEELLFGLMLVSGNDAALTMAQNTGGQAAFVEAMNKRAKEYGMNNTNFMNPHGYHNPQHYTTAADFAKLARQYNKIDYLMKVSQTKSVEVNLGGKATKLNNTNRLLSGQDKDKAYNLPYATGMKTGFASAAKNCFISSAQNGDNGIILVSFGSTSSDVRFSDAKTFLTYGLSNFSPVQIYDYIKDADVSVNYKEINLKEYEYGVFDTMVQINSEEIVNMDVDVIKDLAAEGAQVTAKFNPSKDITFPIKEGDIIGDIEYFSGENIIYSSKAISSKYYTPRKIPSLFLTLRANQQEEFDDQPYVEQIFNLGLNLARNDRGRLERSQKEQSSKTSSETTGSSTKGSTSGSQSSSSSSTNGSSNSTTKQNTTTGSTTSKTTTKKAT